MNVSLPEPRSTPQRPTGLRRLLAGLARLAESLRGSSYWAVRVRSLEHGAAPALERRLRALAGVSAAWVTPSIDGGALVSVSYDRRATSPAAFLAAFHPLARGLSAVDTPETRPVPPEDRCVC